jgi:hypothetical protein
MLDRPVGTYGDNVQWAASGGHPSKPCQSASTRSLTQRRNQCEDTDWIGLCWTILGAAIGALGRDKVLMVRVEHQFPAT